MQCCMLQGDSSLGVHVSLGKGVPHSGRRLKCYQPLTLPLGPLRHEHDGGELSKPPHAARQHYPVSLHGPAGARELPRALMGPPRAQAHGA